MNVNNLKSNILNMFYVVESNKRLFIPIFLLLLFSSCSGASDYPDLYFMYDTGREILNNGIPYTDWFSMHEGLNVVLQQWIVCVIDFVIYDNFGDLGIYVLVSLELFTISLLLFYLYHSRSNNTLVSLFLALFPMLIIGSYAANARPQLWSLIFISSSLIVLTKMINTKNTNYSLILIVLSLFQANFHATFWTALIGIILLYFIWYGYKNKESRIKLALNFIFIVLVGLINPYGIDSLISPYLIIGHNWYDNVSELTPASMDMFYLFYLLPLSAIAISLYFRKGKKKYNSFIVDIILFLIVFVYASFVIRTIIFLEVISMLVLSDIALFNKDINGVKISMNAKKKLEYILISLLLVIFASSQFLNNFAKYRDVTGMCQIEKVTNYMVDNEDDLSNKTLFSEDFCSPEYIVYNTGIKPYIDGRLEIYTEQTNNKYDYLNEYASVFGLPRTEEFSKRYNDLIDKYNFDYLLIPDISNHLINTEGYELVYTAIDDCDNDDGYCLPIHLYKKIKS